MHIEHIATTEHETITEHETTSGIEAIRVKTANEWIQEAKKRPVPKMLFGEMWHEGELAILFGDTGHGKTVLATQIAESIANGRAIEPFEMRAKPHKVLLIDLEMSDKQFEIRYAEDHAGGKANFLHGHYHFSRKFDRVEIDLDEASAVNSTAFAEYFGKTIEDIVAQRGSTVLILDNITFIKRSYYGARETLPLIKMLVRLKKRLGLSILVLAHTHRHEFPRAIEMSDLQESRLLGRYADSIFAIAPNRTALSGYYIKHLKKRSNMLFYTAAHVPVFQLKKIGGNYLGLEFEGFSPEFDLLGDIRRTRGWESINAVKQRSDKGMSLSEIASEIGIPKTSVHRLLKMWRPPAQSSDEVATASADGVVGEPVDLTQRDDYFPGCEEYIDAKDDPKFDILYDEDADENTFEYQLLNREDSLIETAEAHAYHAYKETGIAPKLNDDPDYTEFIRIVQAGGNPFEFDHLPARNGDAEVLFADDDEPEPELPDESVRGLKRKINDHGKEIFVEKEDERGKPIIWYAFDKKGVKMKFERDSNGIGISRPGN